MTAAEALAGIVLLDAAMIDAKGASSITLSDGTQIAFDTHKERLDYRAFLSRIANTATIQRHRYASVSKGT